MTVLLINGEPYIKKSEETDIPGHDLIFDLHVAEVMERTQRIVWGIMWRIAATIITLAAFLVGSLIYVGFYAPHYSFGQDVIVVLVALIIALAAIALTWLSWAGRRGWIPRRWMD